MIKNKSSLSCLTPDSLVFGTRNLAPWLQPFLLEDQGQQGNTETVGPFEINTLHVQKPPKQETWI